ncbi:MAG: SpoIIE family protein phosphatase [Candidatus Kapabacteria bacterium]|jgi:sigma-B regulation protein RsbU (phosphoserine phosphatase)|nr:SpoIIE family protein phosphatase [Candidatus Kapabacteria bacterium]
MNSTTTSNLINLQSLIDLSAALNASDDDAFILNTALLSVMGKLRTFKACALVPNSEGKWFCITTKGMKLPEEPFELELQTDDIGTLVLGSAYQTLVEWGVELSQSVRSSSANDEVQGEYLALLCFGANLVKQPYSDEERQYISLVGSITANALLNARNMRSLRETGSYLERKNQLLTTLFEINREFTALLQKEEILKFLTLRLMGQLAVSRFSILVKSNESSSFEIPVNRLKITEDEAQGLLCEYKELGDEALERCQIFIKDCVMAVPMKTQNEVRGLLLVGEKMNKKPFTAEERNFLEALSGTAMTALENARLFHEELEKKRLEDELNLARTIQKGLLPQELPSITGFEITGMSVSSKQIGGDYYDVIPLSEHEWMLVIADVSGKGTPAALLMANTQAALRALAPLQLPLPSMVSRINDLLYANTSSDKFVTFFCGKLNTQEQTLTFCNAGHNPPLVRRADGTVERLMEGGLILGIMETLVPYEEKSINLTCGDVLLCYTDGVSEALNELHEEYSEERLESALHRSATKSAREIVEVITEDVQSHAGTAPQSDDITMLVLCCNIQ